jgi:hypothetical protein
VLTTDTRLLLKACRDFAEEDTPRLMLADELEATGFGEVAAVLRGARLEASRKHRLETWARRYGYIRWLKSLLELPPESDCVFFGRLWNEFVWQDGRGRACLFRVTRGLPQHLSTTAPMLMERAALQFLFPLTSVFVTGRKPWRDDLDGVWYGWTGSTYPQKWNTWEETPHEIPHTLWERLAAPGTYLRHWNRGHYTRLKDSIDDLNAAALSFGRAAVA